MGLIHHPINCWSGDKFFVSNTSPQVKINKSAGIANMANEIIEVMIIFLSALLKNKYKKYEIGKKASACLFAYFIFIIFIFL